ncbi:MAG: hypothetical protein QW039_01010 [Fervidicoccaceae archaeon]
MARKRRFGISLSEDLAEKLDSICTVLKVTRSSFIQDTVQQGINSHMHYLSEHNCEGIIIAIWPSSWERGSEVEKIMEKFSEIVTFNTHIHSYGKCVLLASLKGSSKTIASLHTELKKLGKISVQYIPFNEMMNSEEAQINR